MEPMEMMEKPDLTKPLNYFFSINARVAEDFQLSKPEETETRYYFEAIGATLEPNDNYFQFTKKSLGQMRDGYKNGLTLTVNHDKYYGLGIGQTAEAEIQNDLLYVQSYILKAMNFRTGPFPTGQDYMNAVQDGFVKNVSVSFIGRTVECSICGNDWRDYRSCQHWPGQDYVVGEGNEKRVVTMIGIVKDAEPLELSLVQVGAEKNASVTRKASNFFSQDQDFAAENQLREAKRKYASSSNNDDNQERDNMDWEARAKELETENATLKSQNATIGAENSTLKAQVDNLTTDKATLETRVETLDRQTQAFDERIKATKDTETAHANEVKELKTTLEQNKQLAEDGKTLRKGLEEEYVKQFGRLKGEAFTTEDKERKLEAARLMSVDDLLNMTKSFKEDADTLYPSGRKTQVIWKTPPLNS